MRDWEIVLATAYEECETDGSNFPFYERLRDRLGSDLSKRLFLPHVDLNKDAGDYLTIQNAIFRGELVLLDMGIPSNAAGIMYQISNGAGIPVIPFHEAGSYQTGQDLILDGSLQTHRQVPMVLKDLEDRGLDQLMERITLAYSDPRATN